MFKIFLIYRRYLRAVAYRWLAKWLWGYMGFENTKPLPACCTMNSGNTTTVQNCKDMCQDRKEELMNNKMFWVDTSVNSQLTLPNIMSSGVQLSESSVP